MPADRQGGGRRAVEREHRPRPHGARQARARRGRRSDALRAALGLASCDAASHVSASFSLNAVVRAPGKGAGELARNSSTRARSSRSSPSWPPRSSRPSCCCWAAPAAATRSRRGSRTRPSSSRATSCRSPACRPARSRTSGSRHDGQAELTLSIDEDYAPLRRGTLATVRQASLSGVANRYIDLRLPGRPRADDPRRRHDRAGQHDDGGRPRRDLQHARSRDPPQGPPAGDQGLGRPARRPRRADERRPAVPQPVAAGLLAAVPRAQLRLRSCSSASSSPPRSSSPTSPTATRTSPGLVDNLATTTNAIGSEQQALADSVEQLPAFMRRANTTFLNLRATLDDLEPLVDDSKPVAKKLRPFLAELRPLAQDARPTFDDLSALLKQPGRRQRPDRPHERPGAAARRRRARRQGERQGPRRARSRPRPRRSSDATPQIAYMPARTRSTCSAGSTTSATPAPTTRSAPPRASASTPARSRSLDGQLTPVPPELRDEAFQAAASTDQRNRCPGGGDHKSDDGSRPWKPTPDFNCDPSQVLPGK